MEDIGPFELIEPIGRGGMGAVWLARHRRLDWLVALKRIDASVPGVDPLAEIRAIAGMHHQHIVRILDFGEDSHGLWLAMERAEGTLADQPPGRWTEVLVVLESVLLALAHAHARGVLHLDVKPANVLRMVHGQGFRWVLADFGLAHDIGSKGSEHVRGTPAYMAPEQFSAPTIQLGPATDLYAVGCLAGLLVSGRAPFQGTSWQELALEHRSRAPPPLTPIMDVPEELEDWWRRLLAKDPGDRYRLAADALEALESMSPVSGDEVPVTVYRAETFHLDDMTDALVPVEPLSELESSASLTTTTPRMVPGPDLIDLRVLPLVGRECELEALRDELAAVAATGEPRVVCIDGPPGSGRHHLARSFATLANEAGQALLSSTEPDRPVIRVADEVEDIRGAVLQIVPGRSSPGAGQITLGPLTDPQIARIARNLVHLDETVVRHVVRASHGNPGRAVGMIRNWAARGKLVPGPFGHTVEDDGDDWLASLVPDDPLFRLAWSVEEDPDEALALLEPLVDEARTHGNPARALSLVDLTERALARSASPRPRLAWTVASLRAGTLVGMGQMSSAWTAAKQAVERAEALDDPEAVATSLLQQAHPGRFCGEDPLPLLERAEHTSKEPGTIARARATRGSVLIVARRYDEARPLLQSAAELLEEHGIASFLGTTRLWLGNTCHYQGDNRSALAQFDRALDAFERLGHQVGIAHARLAKAMALTELQELDRAQEQIEIIRQIARRVGSPYLTSEVSAADALVLERSGDLEGAVRVLRRALEELSDTEIPLDTMRVGLARVLLKAGRTGEAATCIAASGTHSRDSDASLVALRLATLPTSDPRWETLLRELEAQPTLSTEVREVLELAAERADPAHREQVEALLALHPD